MMVLPPLAYSDTARALIGDCEPLRVRFGCGCMIAG
jgi:hypothetical protein